MEETTIQAPAPEPEPPSPPPPAAPAPRVGRKGPFFWGLLSGCLVVFLFVMFAGIVAAVWSDDEEKSFALGSKVAVIPLEGEITESRRFIEQLHRYAKSTSVKAIVVRINSPGGGIVPSQEIFEEIRKVRTEHRKPVVASLDSVAASGGYYVAAACDRIVANPGTITGSIGVIFQWFNVQDLLKWAHLKPETLTAGTMKDAGSPFRDLSESEKAYFTTIINQLHSQFIRAVAVGRNGKLSEEEVRKLADGRVFTGEQAKQLKLVDELGNLQDAVKVAASLAGIKGEASTVYPKKEKPGLLELLAGSESAEALFERIVAARMRQFLYRW